LTNHNPLQTRWLKDNSPKNREALEAAETQLSQWTTELHINNHRYAELKYPELFDVRQVQQAIVGHDTAVEYALGVERSSVWVVQEGCFEMLPLPSGGNRGPGNPIRNSIANAPNVSPRAVDYGTQSAHTASGCQGWLPGLSG